MPVLTSPQDKRPRAALYVRVSKKEQDPRMQFASLRDLARLRGYRIVAVYRERKSSVVERKEWRRVMHDAAMRRFERSLRALALAAVDAGGCVLMSRTRGKPWQITAAAGDFLHRFTGGIHWQPSPGFHCRAFTARQFADALAEAVCPF